jgi:hypothetical protein
MQRRLDARIGPAFFDHEIPPLHPITGMVYFRISAATELESIRETPETRLVVR